jgi:hypothetical protein
MSILCHFFGQSVHVNHILFLGPVEFLKLLLVIFVRIAGVGELQFLVQILPSLKNEKVIYISGT